MNYNLETIELLIAGILDNLKNILEENNKHDFEIKYEKQKRACEFEYIFSIAICGNLYTSEKFYKLIEMKNFTANVLNFIFNPKMITVLTCEQELLNMTEFKVEFKIFNTQYNI